MIQLSFKNDLNSKKKNIINRKKKKKLNELI